MIFVLYMTSAPAQGLVRPVPKTKKFTFISPFFCFGIFLPLFELKLEQMPSRHESWAVAQFAHFNEKAKAFIYSWKCLKTNY